VHLLTGAEWYAERAFLKAFSSSLQILKLNLKSTIDSKIPKIWIFKAI
jgi:hypothetical protein